MELLILIIVTFIGSTIQTATGFGFALLAVTPFLMVLNSGAAFQLVMVICLVISLAVWPKLAGLAPKSLLVVLAAGCAVGFPIGLAALSWMDLEALKAMVGIVVIFVAGQTAWQFRLRRRATEPGNEQSPAPRTGAGFSVGVVSGALTSALAMPGPVVMLYLSRTGLDKDAVRATILTFFIFAYGGALALQAGLVGIEAGTWKTAAILVPPALAGVAAGHALARRITQAAFRWTILAILLCNGLFILAGVLI
jgi:uncharacterized membrane protein YfcA